MSGLAVAAAERRAVEERTRGIGDAAVANRMAQRSAARAALEERERRLQEGDGCAPYPSPTPASNTAAHPRFDVGKINEYKARTTELSRKMLATVSELSMF